MAEMHRRERDEKAEEPKGDKPPEPKGDKTEKPEEAAQAVADAPNPMGPPAEGTMNPALASAAELTKAHYGRLPKGMRASLDVHRIGLKQFVRDGTRWEILTEVGPGVYATKVESSPPKHVHFLPAPTSDEYMDDE